jgi:hypothetical protein
MINDKGFVDAYAAIYEKKEDKDKKRWQDDDGDDKWYEKSDVDGKISKREKDEKKSKKKDDEDDKDEDKKEDKKKETNEEVINEYGGLIAKGAAMGAKFVAKKGGKAALKKAAISGAKVGAVNTAIDHATRGGDVEESVKLEDAEGNPSVEILDLVLPDPIKSTVRKEETEVETDELLESRLWDQVAANLTTLGEMRGIKYKVSPLKEGYQRDPDRQEKDRKTSKQTDPSKDGFTGIGDSIEDIMKQNAAMKKAAAKKTKKEETEVNIDAAMQQQTPFNVKSPVIFSNKKTVVEEEKEDLTSKYAPNIIKADASMKEAVGEIAGTVAGTAAGTAIAGPVGGFVGGMAGGALGSKLDKKKPARKK